MALFDALEDEEDAPAVIDETSYLPIKGSYCPTCKGYVRLSIMPDAETNVATGREFRQDARDGCEIKILPKIEAIAHDYCSCEKPKKRRKRI
jgi:hypothetical protein